MLHGAVAGLGGEVGGVTDKRSKANTIVVAATKCLQKRKCIDANLAKPS